MTKEIESKKKCSQCGVKVEKNSKRYKEYMETLEFLFPKSQAPNVVPFVSAGDMSHITIINFTGESINVKYNADTTIEAVKKEVKERMKIALEQQVLLHKSEELKVCALT